MEKLLVALDPPSPCNSVQPVIHRSLLYNGSKFRGHQKSKGNCYNVEVTFQQVDLATSYLCGYLKIDDLTKDFPTMTTFFDGEIISERYPFLTRKWEADEEVDKKHWGKFSAFNNHFAESFNSDDFDYKKLSSSDCVFMRWKVPIAQLETRTGTLWACLCDKMSVKPTS